MSGQPESLVVCKFVNNFSLKINANVSIENDVQGNEFESHQRQFFFSKDNKFLICNACVDFQNLKFRRSAISIWFSFDKN
jgi:hypothetical protein